MTRNISFSRSSAVSTVFGVNCASVATKVTFAGNTYPGSRIEGDARFIADGERAGDARRHEDRHVDIAQVEQRQDPAARRKDLAGLRQLVLDAAEPAGATRVEFVDLRLRRRHLGLPGRDLGLRGIAAGDGRIIARLGALQLVWR